MIGLEETERTFHEVAEVKLPANLCPWIDGFKAAAAFAGGITSDGNNFLLLMHREAHDRIESGNDSFGGYGSDTMRVVSEHSPPA